jgi:hypothetical protein
MEIEPSEAERMEAFLLANGFRKITDEDLKKPQYREEIRANLRILANDDTSIPAPNEEEELDKECGPAIQDQGSVEG